ncbi:RNA polymerase sigma factor [uncultured Polaribacter sp.]|uniref:RNA polymerase sigma factor n=1 Tax=uncultured Polaribacter sp. TaxID=174711 RepID=UPI002626CA3F|nr:RNA polymerase sigma-70 factor [uncultured Polaribacter sp.]
MTYTTDNEKHIITEIQNGNKAAYRAIYLYAYERLCIYVLNFTTDRNIAEDVVQETFLKLWDKRSSLRIEGSLKGYLYKLAYHEYINLYRKKVKMHQELETFRLESLSELLEDNDALFQERLEKVQTAIETLPPRCKEIFVMNKQNNMRYKEIAAQLGISVKTVENQIGKALKRIRKEVQTQLFSLLFLLMKRVVKG